MSRQESQATLTYSIAEALDLLTAIAEVDVEIDPERHLTHQQMVSECKPLLSQAVQWIGDPDLSSSVEKVRSLFNVLYGYLSTRLEEGERAGKRGETVENIKQIMVIAGEAAKKLDKFTDLFDYTNPHSAIKLPEYRKLQQFYRKKIDQRIEEGVLAEWILALHSFPLQARAAQESHLFVDMENVLKDIDYELLLMRREDGARFFNPKLLRNLKLSCEFGGALQGEKKEGVPFSVPIWQDRVFQTVAKNILHAVRAQVRFFFKELFRYRTHEWALEISQALFALMLASHEQHLLEHNAVKNCSEYFYDFQVFLRRALNCREYQKALVYPPPPTHQLACGLLLVTQKLCAGFYIESHGLQQMYHEIDALLSSLPQEQSKEREQAAEKLLKNYRAMHNLLLNHSQMALMRTIDWIEEGGSLHFDPLMQFNLPNQFFDAYIGSGKISNVRMPSPVHQERIDSAAICEEFKAFLYAYKESNQRHLYFNLQDRTSWKEFARSERLERLGSTEEFENVLDVVTLATGTLFYHQTAEYAEMNDAHSFMQQFIENLKSASSGYHFPERITKEIALFCSQAAPAIHTLFFGARATLEQNERRDFITLMHLLLQFKCIDLLHCHSYSMTCKDGLDVGVAASALQFFFWKLRAQKIFSDADYEYLNFMIYAPSLLVRERAMRTDVFERMISAIKRLEDVCQEYGYDAFIHEMDAKLATLYEGPILNGIISYPRV